MKTKLLISYWLKSLILLIYLHLSASHIAVAQNYTTYKTASKKVLKWYERGKLMLKAKQLEEANRYFSNAVKEDPSFIDGYLRIGDIALEQKDIKLAIPKYEQVVALDSSYSLRVHSILGKLYYQTDQLEEALPYLNYFIDHTRNEKSKENIKQLVARIHYAIEAKKNPVPFLPKRLSSAINTEGWEYLPSFRADGKELVFTRVVATDLQRGQEDFYYSEKIQGEWTPSKPITELNTPYNQGAQSISGDGQTLVFTGCQQRDGLGSCDLYISYKKGELWIVHLG